MRLTLPFWARFALFVLAAAMPWGYALLNHPSVEMRVLESPVDRALPLVPIFAVPYLLFLALFWLVFTGAFVARRGFEKLAFGVIAIHLMSFVVFASFQTYVPRPVLQGQSPSISLLRLIYAIDKPFNAFPSLHVSSAVLLWLYLGQFGRRASGIGLTVAVVTAMSTLLIKQHVLADVAGGALVGVTGALLAHRACQHFLTGDHSIPPDGC